MQKNLSGNDDLDSLRVGPDRGCRNHVYWGTVQWCVRKSGDHWMKRVVHVARWLHTWWDSPPCLTLAVIGRYDMQHKKAEAENWAITINDEREGVVAMVRDNFGWPSTGRSLMGGLEWNVEMITGQKLNFQVNRLMMRIKLNERCNVMFWLIIIFEFLQIQLN